MCDLLIAGAGQLGCLVAKQWKSANPQSKITLKFRSHNEERAKRLADEGFSVISQDGGEACIAPLVVFCAPPTGNPDYAGDIKSCIENHWSKEEAGAFVFTSAGSVYGENNGGDVDESSETIRTERSGKLLDAEQHVLEAGGCVVRLGGLYTIESGAHNFWLRGGEFPAKPNGLINLVHYKDASSAVVRCLENPTKVSGEVFLVSDGSPISRQDIVNAACCHEKFAGKASEVKFTGDDTVDGKKYVSAKIRSLLGWKPEYNSFKDFMSTC